MRLYRCLQYLHKSLRNSPKADLVSEGQHQVVAGARLWLAVGRWLSIFYADNAARQTELRVGSDRVNADPAECPTTTRSPYSSRARNKNAQCSRPNSSSTRSPTCTTAGWLCHARCWRREVGTSGETSLTAAHGFRPYSTMGSRGVNDVDSLLRKVNKALDEVYSYWLDYYRGPGLQVAADRQKALACRQTIFWSTSVSPSLRHR